MYGLASFSSLALGVITTGTKRELSLIDWFLLRFFVCKAFIACQQSVFWLF